MSTLVSSSKLTRAPLARSTTPANQTWMALIERVADWFEHIYAAQDAKPVPTAADVAKSWEAAKRRLRLR